MQNTIKSFAYVTKTARTSKKYYMYKYQIIDLQSNLQGQNRIANLLLYVIIEWSLK